MADFIVAGIILVIIGAASAYIMKAKKNGVKCIGCPAGGCSGKGGCSGNGNDCCSGGCHSDADER